MGRPTSSESKQIARRGNPSASEELLRERIRLSWMRSRMAAAPLDRIDIPYREDDGGAERLVRAASPILDRFAEQLTDTNVSIVLADRNARVVGRWAADRSALSRLSKVSIEEGFILAEELAGTNGIGTVLEEMAPLCIFGAEHYSEPLQRLVCVGAPIRHPLTRRIEGVVDLSCTTTEASNLMMPTLIDLSLQIERELSTRSSVRERIVFDEFLGRSKETSAALVGIAEQFMVTNAAAADLLESRDQRLLWEQTAHARSGSMRLELASGTIVNARSEEIKIGSIVAGALLEFSVESVGHVVRPATPSLPSGSNDPILDNLLSGGVTRISIVGESGSGKLTRARELHELLHPNEQLTIQNCGMALVEGATLWLRALQTRLADPQGTIVIRNVEVLDDSVAQALIDLLSATGQNEPFIIVTRSTNRGSERVGLQQTVGPAVLNVAPLRRRRDDLPDLVYGILRNSGSPARVGTRALAALINYGWPGNFPQLHHVVEEAARQAAGAPVGLEHLGDEVRDATRGRRDLSRIESLERELIVDALREHGGNRVKVAIALGMSRSTLYRRLRLYNLDTNRTIL